MTKTTTLHSGEYLALHASFCQWLELLNYSEGTRQVIPYHAREFLAYEEGAGKAQIGQIEAVDAQGFLEGLKAKIGPRTGRCYSPAHLNKYIQALGLLSRYLRESGRGHGGFALQWLDLPERKPTWLTIAEVNKLYDATTDTVLGARDRAMLSVYYGCGLRLSEGAALDVRDVLLDQGLVHVRKGKGYKERLVPLAGGSRSTLEHYLASARPQLLQSRPTEALFVGASKGQAMTSQSLYIRIKQLAQKARIKKRVGAHTLRHSIATHLLGSGMQLERIKDFLGHDSLDSTQLYTHLVNQQL
jgi:integrase/recombinase XerD